ncbi:hypothetical protein JQ557_31000 [Bradyrhizobium sp. U87765 SZCCT0131]|uniref:hypothetical protein n=1 Tax=unclassified Bradyrhizobium TaxID=2631580 RepID=UPI001BA46447|nr:MULTISPECIES: hypothetical protein [unclassified Bradyrhizobium]MBR1222462.1 hypothetical protein [Bradyrhizobium sp. U87765 SZCCT0131]MBR1264054.1 hypothetical protein [Bradyrhizobium sp. U87765 SZCCT0134]MBR1308163.1 hypothetical protein [Bradyrhizobium sp. U87765 SZCCT0110]MBR1320304.1 hypothetical protein [Bradyrhizobium sp. U87765 SZCCT0109]MBR1348583.1 hypothetical protein [Bradyrhizobium sp. U87765 SZCCT0048]
MISAPPPPAGSTISIQSDGADTLVAIPYPASPSRYFAGLFLLCWLGGWAFGVKDAGGRVLSGQANGFIMFWLAGWLIGGGFAMYMAFRHLRPPIPETLRLTQSGIDYDAGVPPPPTTPRTGSWNWQATFPKRIRLNLNRMALRTLQLRPTDNSNRLTIDVGTQRIDIARAATEIEREWLYRVIAGRYSLPPAESGRSAAE